MKTIQFLLICVTWLLAGAGIALCYVVYQDSHKVVIDLPEEIHAVGIEDNMKMFYNMNKDTLFVEYNNHHVCIDSTHASCKPGGYNLFSNDEFVIGTKKLGCLCQGKECHDYEK